MSKSIYEILESLETETSVPRVTDKKTGNVLREDMGMVAHTLPATLLPTSKQFENEAMLLDWARSTGCLHACLQGGVQGFIIDLRAKFKAMKKGETWSPELGQKNVDNAKWTVVARPSGKSQAEIATNYLASLTPEQLADVLAKLNK